MTIPQFAYRSLFIRKIRTFLTVMGVAIVVAVFFTVYTFSTGYRQALQSEYSSFGINILAVPKGCPYEATSLLMHGGKMDKSMSFEQLEEIRKHPGIDIASPIHIHHARLEPGNYETALYGIEETMFTLKSEWKLEGTPFSGVDVPEAYLGSQAMRVLNLSYGDIIKVNIVLGEEKKEFEVKLVGSLKQTGTSDDNFIFLPILFIKNIVPEGHTIKGIAIRVKAGASIGQVAEELNQIGDVQTVTYKQVQYTLNDLLDTTIQLLNMAMIFTLLIGVIGLMNTIFMSIEDRKKELGMLKAIGANNQNIFMMIMTETGILVFIGSIIGIVSAILLSKTMEFLVRKLIASAPPGQLSHLSLPVILITVSASVLIGTLVSIIPCFKATNISPMEVIRNE